LFSILLGTIAHLEQSNKTEEAMIVVRVLVVNQAVTITVIWIRDDENYNDAGAAAVAAGDNDEGGDDDDDDDTNEPGK